MVEVIRVAIYEDNSDLREILSSIVKNTDGLELAGEFGHCKEILKNTDIRKPDVILMDIDLSGKSGIEGTLDVKTAFPMTAVIMNTVFDDDDKIFRAIQAGATGYLLKKKSLAGLIRSKKDVKVGGAPMSPAIARRVLARINTVDKPVNKDGNVYINDTQYFAYVPEVAYTIYIGGYQPAQKWLKDRKGRNT